MKFNQSDLERAVEELSMCEFFPTQPGAQTSVQHLLARMCPSREALRWLTDTMVNRVGKWRGPTELRGLLCWKYRPIDGIEASCSIAGFTAADGESRSLAEHEALKAIEGGPHCRIQGPHRGLVRAGDAAVKLLAVVSERGRN